MKIKNIILATLLTVIIMPASANTVDKIYSGKGLDHIDYPIGGLGSGMFCISGTGAITNLSFHHYPQLFHEPCAFAAVHVKGIKNGAKVLETSVPDYKIFGRKDGGMGVGGTTWGLPRFEKGTFSTRFPFAEINLSDKDMPLDVNLIAWNPFIPNDEDNSGLPVGGLEYTFTNTSKSQVEAIFSFNTRNFMCRTNDEVSPITKMDKGFVLNQIAPKNAPEMEGHCAIFTDEENTKVNYNWFRGGWFDPLTIAWNHVENGEMPEGEPKLGGTGASIYVPFILKPGESKTIHLYMTWYVPHSFHNIGPDAVSVSDFGDRYNADLYKDTPAKYEPWYSRRFSGIEEVSNYWKNNYSTLKLETKKFTDTFYDTTLPEEVIESVANNLTILKSPTVMRQHDGRFWVWEGSGDDWGSCHGSCTHVWNYAQAVPHLFPRMERTLRETEFKVDQNTDGHQAFRANIPIRPVKHDFHSAADGQLGGIMKVYRDWRISGDNEWIKDLYPLIVKSMDYCIRTWDPNEVGAVIEPHHNTYDIEFWGPDGMCTSFYAGALNCIIEIGHYLNEDVTKYEHLLKKAQDYMETNLWNGEYFFQDIQWEGLKTPDPTKAQSFQSSYSEEARKILEKEGPKYQYGNGCLSDGIIGCWMSLVCGLDEPIDQSKVTGHLESVYKYNLKHCLADHANPQRPGYAVGNDGGLILCSWPKSGKLSLPFVYSDEVWTGIEYQVASHLIFEGKVKEGLDIVRTVLNRYDGIKRNPFNQYECGSWYARALSSYSLIQALTGVRYDAVTKTLHIESKVGKNFRSFLSTASGYATVGLKNGKPFIEVKNGEIEVKEIIVK